MAVYSTGGIENRVGSGGVSGVRPFGSVVIRLANNSAATTGPVVVNIFQISPAGTTNAIPNNFAVGTQTTFGLYSFTLGAFGTAGAAVTIDNVPTAFDSFGVQITMPGSVSAGTATVDVEITIRDTTGRSVLNRFAGELAIVG